MRDLRTTWRLIGVGLVAISVIVLLEASRLDVFVASVGVGPATFTRLLGLMAAALGVLLVIAGDADGSPKVQWPSGHTATVMSSSVGVLAVYVLLLQLVGYTVATLIGSVLLFKVMAGVRWRVSVLIGGTVAAALYMVFLVLLGVPLPSSLWW